MREEALRTIRQVLGPARVRAAEQRGAAMSLDTAAEYALMLTAPAPPPAPPTGSAKLSGREQELVRLVAACHASVRPASVAGPDSEQNNRNDHDPSAQGWRSKGQPTTYATAHRDDGTVQTDAENYAAVAAYRLSMKAGNPLSERKLAQMFGRTPLAGHVPESPKHSSLRRDRRKKQSCREGLISLPHPGSRTVTDTMAWERPEPHRTPIPSGSVMDAVSGAERTDRPGMGGEPVAAQCCVPSRCILVASSTLAGRRCRASGHLARRAGMPGTMR